jgi:multidrug efflux pump subunit AcrA (membrane-fusion protein)
VSADIHESLVKRVRRGQSVTILIDAMPKTPLRGEVLKVAPLPNADESWFNPDRKVFSASIGLDGAPREVRPGMSARVEILIEEKDDVLLLPVQAVAGTVDQPVAWVVEEEGAEAVERPIELGLSNDRFAEVLSGLTSGDVVVLSPPRADRMAGNGNGNGQENGKAPPGGGKAAPTADPGRPSGKRPGGSGRPGGRRPSGKSGSGR